MNTGSVTQVEVRADAPEKLPQVRADAQTMGFDYALIVIGDELALSI